MIIERRYTDVEIQHLIEEIQDNVEWLSTTDENEVECIGIENLEGILSKYLGVTIKLTKE